MKYHNYNFFPCEFKRGSEFYYLCSNHYDELVNLILKMNDEYIKEKLSQNISLRDAANTNEIEVLYYLLSEKTSIDDDCFKGNKNLRKSLKKTNFMFNFDQINYH